MLVRIIGFWITLQHVSNGSSVSCVPSYQKKLRWILNLKRYLEINGAIYLCLMHQLAVWKENKAELNDLINTVWCILFGAVKWTILPGVRPIQWPQTATHQDPISLKSSDHPHTGHLNKTATVNIALNYGQHFALRFLSQKLASTLEKLDDILEPNKVPESVDEHWPRAHWVCNH